MAGADPEGAFDPDEYRAGIRQARLMGLPEDVALQPTFLYPSATVHTRADPGNRPWNLNAPAEPPAEEPPPPKRVLCGIITDDLQRAYTSVGKFEADRAILSFFETEWADVNSPVPFVKVLIGGKPYKRAAELKPSALFTVTNHRVEVVADDR